MKEYDADLWKKILESSGPAILKTNLKLEYDGSNGETKIKIHPDDPIFDHLKRKAMVRDFIRIVSVSLKVSVNMMGIQAFLNEENELDMRIATTELPLSLKFLNQDTLRKKHTELVDKKIKELKESAKGKEK